ncbi:unnamed protein product [Acanthoscelides obtectus]|uniref:Uncharacterized protein n=1 Tax=Acanthoscelides obtectus TaxID=200917 RepID=A0A9P0KXV4_ACAOB|nr:unnamed protein product [Acanthoscelides obtectus]CAK1645613.1 hypothetical protein AOBTE_LOCUS14170 [Acanthoscelides obtectus]
MEDIRNRILRTRLEEATLLVGTCISSLKEKVEAISHHLQTMSYSITNVTRPRLVLAMETRKQNSLRITMEDIGIYIIRIQMPPLLLDLQPVGFY